MGGRTGHQHSPGPVLTVPRSLCVLKDNHVDLRDISYFSKELMEISSYGKTNEAKLKCCFSLVLAEIISTWYSHGNMNCLINEAW